MSYKLKAVLYVELVLAAVVMAALLLRAVCAVI